jgi:hypothetical protein
MFTCLVTLVKSAIKVALPSIPKMSWSKMPLPKTIGKPKVAPDEKSKVTLSVTGKGITDNL